ncbi:Cyclodeaminase/cyclohydrolase domain protein, partial [mine drainage metagenome]
EIVGVVPYDALLDAAEYYLQLNRFDRGAILERKVATVDSTRPGHESVADFTARLAARAPTPGGGSAAAIAGAIGTALGEMVFAYTHPVGAAPADWTDAVAELSALRRRFLELSDEDGASYEAVRKARRALKEQPDDPDRRAAERAALRDAALVPLETARRAARVLELLDERGPSTRKALGSDLTTA